MYSPPTTQPQYFKSNPIQKPLRDGREVVYLSGPMAGYEDFNEAAFRTAARELEERGYFVIVPHDGEDRSEWVNPDPFVKDEVNRPLIQKYMHHDFLQILLEAHLVVVLPGWEESTGARDEVRVAQVIGLPVLRFADYTTLPPKSVVTILGDTDEPDH